MCEAGPIVPDRDAGSRAVADLIGGLAALGHDVRAFIEARTELGDPLSAFDPELIMVSRPGLFVRAHGALRRFGVPLVYLGHDLHFVRLGLQDSLNAHGSSGSSVMRVVERECVSAADLTVLPTELEAKQARAEFPGARVRSMRYFAMSTVDVVPDPPSSTRLVFVGGSFHEPNRDAIHWFADNVWARLSVSDPDAVLEVCGDWAETDRRAARGVNFTGRISDIELDRTIDAARIGVAPLRFGAGMKRKTLHMLSRGRPVLGTSFAVQGLPDGPGGVPGVIVVETADDVLAGIERLRDDAEWRRLANEGVELIRREFSDTAYLADLQAIIAAVGR